jgi:hypothetical protein
MVWTVRHIVDGCTRSAFSTMYLYEKDRTVNLYRQAGIGHIEVEGNDEDVSGSSGNSEIRSGRYRDTDLADW